METAIAQIWKERFLVTNVMDLHPLLGKMMMMINENQE